CPVENIYPGKQGPPPPRTTTAAAATSTTPTIVAWGERMDPGRGSGAGQEGIVSRLMPVDVGHSEVSEGLTTTPAATMTTTRVTCGAPSAPPHWPYAGPQDTAKYRAAAVSSPDKRPNIPCSPLMSPAKRTGSTLGPLGFIYPFFLAPQRVDQGVKFVSARHSPDVSPVPRQ
ncbi:unnamed protein product, partial [Pleuronectes platessa]